MKNVSNLRKTIDVRLVIGSFLLTLPSSVGTRILTAPHAEENCQESTQLSLSVNFIAFQREVLEEAFGVCLYKK